MLYVIVIDKKSKEICKPSLHAPDDAAEHPVIAGGGLEVGVVDAGMGAVAH